MRKKRPMPDPPVDEARGRRLAKILSNRYNFKDLSVQQAEDVLLTAEELRRWMKARIEDGNRTR